MIDCTSILPPSTLARVAPIVEDFKARGVSGQVTVVLHFCAGREMPSEVGTHERNVGGKQRTEEKP